MTLLDLMFKANTKAAWDAFVAANNLADTCDIDEIGPVEGQNWHVNVRVTSPDIDPAVIAQGGPGVEWIDPALVEAPIRIWAGGMNYWKPGA